jgi:hypothetical protein
MFFFIFGHFERPPPTLEKKSQILEFLAKTSSNFGISDVKFWPKIWPIGQKYSLVLYSDQDYFESDTVITKFSNAKTKPSSLKRV